MAIEQEASMKTSNDVATISVKSRGREILPLKLLQELPPELQETPLQICSELEASQHLLLTTLQTVVGPADLNPAIVTLASREIRSVTDET
ncbi:hypothetical protein ACI50E_07220 [Brucella sp. ZJ1_1]|uniref:Uncharacterized protein n=2 Tax=Brucella intermedia TaxID=94625 RepID=U4VJW0_9HYPH|nr:hypothetical protein [Brucella intermedia]ERM03182.1 hypothetical protein Q644_12765 [Brucella intermedia 229E]ELT50880.1 hypothetical protein D584_02020 [Brucella intermedia M86]MCB4917907.1 hypothetical protein [Brucella intermedia]NKB94738.1 hypothetical protein [Brucella intermedia]OOC50510.1 hypothetical protein AS855_08865 [Brucella intermedia M86]